MITNKKFGRVDMMLFGDTPVTERHLFWWRASTDHRIRGCIGTVWLMLTPKLIARCQRHLRVSGEKNGISTLVLFEMI